MPVPSAYPAPPAYMGDALAAVAEELRRLGGMGERLQDALSPLFLTSPTVIAEAQALDRIAQYAHDLATFVAHCGQACAPEWTMNPTAAVADLKLSELAARLGGPPVTEAPGSNAVTDLAHAGDLELW